MRFKYNPFRAAASVLVGICRGQVTIKAHGIGASEHLRLPLDISWGKKACFGGLENDKGMEKGREKASARIQRVNTWTQADERVHGVGNDGEAVVTPSLEV